MEQEGYTPVGAIREAEETEDYHSAKEQTAIAETEKAETLRPSWMDFLFVPLIAYDRNSLEAGQAVLEQQVRNGDMSLEEIFFADNALYNVELELLRRKNPQARDAIDTWKAIADRKYAEGQKWEQHILET